MSEKQCLKCGNHKSRDEYYASSHPRHTDGLNPYCKWCCKVNRALESVRKRDKKSKISYRQEYRAKAMNATVEAGILLVQVFEADLGICYICKEWVEPRHASMDHVAPLSRGGSHTRDNLRLTHLYCNLVKGHRT